MTSTLQVTQGMCVCGPGAVKERCHHLRRDVVDARRMPTRRVVFVHGQGTDALHRVGLSAVASQVQGMETMPHQVALHAQVLGQIHLAGNLYLTPSITVLPLVGVREASAPSTTALLNLVALF